MSGPAKHIPTGRLCLVSFLYNFYFRGCAAPCQLAPCVAVVESKEGSKRKREQGGRDDREDGKDDKIEGVVIRSSFFYIAEVAVLLRATCGAGLWTVYLR